jgi:Zn-dependent protease with chaperone function
MRWFSPHPTLDERIDAATARLTQQIDSAELP